VFTEGVAVYNTTSSWKDEYSFQIQQSKGFQEEKAKIEWINERDKCWNPLLLWSLLTSTESLTLAITIPLDQWPRPGNPINSTRFFFLKLLRGFRDKDSKIFLWLFLGIVLQELLI
jgi:hypothetical protein